MCRQYCTSIPNCADSQSLVNYAINVICQSQHLVKYTVSCSMQALLSLITMVLQATEISVIKFSNCNGANLRKSQPISNKLYYSMDCGAAKNDSSSCTVLAWNGLVIRQIRNLLHCVQCYQLKGQSWLKQELCVLLKQQQRNVPLCCKDCIHAMLQFSA